MSTVFFVARLDSGISAYRMFPLTYDLNGLCLELTYTY